MTENKENTTTIISENEHKELCLLYENATANLEARKKSQWQVLVFYSAIIAFLITQANNLSILAKLLISVTLPFGAMFIQKMVKLYKEKMAEERKVLSNIYERLGAPFRECRSAKGDVLVPDPFETSFSRAAKFYIIIAFFSAVLSFWNEFIVKLFNLICN